MKKLQFFLLAAVAIVFAACSNDDVVLTDNGGSTGDGAGDAYLTLNINLPTQTSTRASSANDQFDEGLHSEYYVNDAHLFLFVEDESNSGENYAHLYAAYDLSNHFNYVHTSEITEKETITSQIQQPSDNSAPIYALVVLNGGSLLSLTPDATTPSDGTKATLTIGGTSITIDETSGATLSYLQTLACAPSIDATTIGTSGIFMTNTPLSTTIGGTSANGTVPAQSNIQVLSPITRTKIHHTEAEAVGDPAADIYVERAVAKVTVEQVSSLSSTNTTIKDLGTITISAAALDYTNKSTYMVRNTGPTTSWWGYSRYNTDGSTATDYRFVGTDMVESPKSLYRTYWAIDSNYDNYTNDVNGTNLAANFNTISTSQLSGATPSVGIGTIPTSGYSDPMYCLENTFNVKHMNQDETTRLVVKAALGSNDFYTIDGSIYTLAELNKVVVDKILDLPTVSTYAAAWTTKNTTNDEYVDHISVTYDMSDPTNVLITGASISSLTQTDFGDSAEALSSFSSALNALNSSATGNAAADYTKLNNSFEIYYYKNGVCYYPVLIMHFGDTLTPWSIIDIETYGVDGGSTSDSYPDGLYGTETAEEDWLGRYGVLRNNWYDITITNVKEVGYPTVPTPENVPDDEVKDYIEYNINVVSWAKRTQEVEL